MRALFFATILGGLSACAATEAEPTSSPAPSTDVGKSTPLPAPPAADAGPKKEDAAPAKNECKLDAMTGVAAVTPSFVTYALPNDVPAAMTGGALAGQYAVDNAVVFLPSGTAGLVYPEQSTGSINAWAVFDGTNYRLHLKAAFTIASAAGPQSQGVDTESQGGFTMNSEVILLDHACDTAIAQEADYSFTDEGNGRATILIKTPTPYGDTYLQLDASKM